MNTPPDFKVLVRCFTYNHALFIVDAMNGFTMQQTNFPFICVIVDDASIDGEPNIIRKYLQDNFDIIDNTININEETDDYILIFARHKTNNNCYFAVFLLKYNHYRKKSKYQYFAEWFDSAIYLAVCEGDDYWIDSHKLQKQYDVLEKDNSISMCHHNFYEQNEKSEKTILVRDIPMRQDLISVAKNNSTQTLTMFYRNIKPLIPDELKGRHVYSQFWAMRLAEYGDIYYINEPMAVYRRHAGGIFGKQDAFTKLSMFSMNLDNMVYWYELSDRQDVVSVLKKRGKKTCIKYLLHFLRKMEPVYIYKAFKMINKYI